jgi:hypothetical protein
LKEKRYSAQEAKVATRKHNKVAIVLGVMYRENTDAQARTTALKGRANKHRLLKNRTWKIKRLIFSYFKKISAKMLQIA